MLAATKVNLKRGFGRELGAHAVEHYTELKTLWLNLGYGEGYGFSRTVTDFRMNGALAPVLIIKVSRGV
jgi:hypothetical protein